MPVKVKAGPQTGWFVDLAAADDGGHEQDEAEDRDFADLARPDEARVEAHQDRDRDRGRYGEGAPGALGQRLDHDHRQHGEQDHHDHESAEQRDHAGDHAEFGPDQFTEGAPIAAHGDEQDHEVLNRAREHDAGQDPEHAGQVAHLRGQDRADEGTRACDRREMVTEQDGLVGGNVVEPVIVTMGGCLARRVEAHHLLGDVERVVPVGDEVDADCGHDDPQGVDRFAAAGGDNRQGCRAQRTDKGPWPVLLYRTHRRLAPATRP